MWSRCLGKRVSGPLHPPVVQAAEEKGVDGPMRLDYQPGAPPHRPTGIGSVTSRRRADGRRSATYAIRGSGGGGRWDFGPPRATVLLILLAAAAASHRIDFPFHAVRHRARVKVTDYFKTLPAAPRIRSIFTMRATTANRTDRRHTVPLASPSFFLLQPTRTVGTRFHSS